MYSHKNHPNNETKLINSRKPNNSRIHRLINLQTQKLINSITNELIKPRTNELINSPVQKLKMLFFTLQTNSNFRSILAKTLVKK